MPFQIQPVKEFLVRPALPPVISRMSDLAYNLLWSWDHTHPLPLSAAGSGAVEELRP